MYETIKVNEKERDLVKMYRTGFRPMWMHPQDILKLAQKNNMTIARQDAENVLQHVIDTFDYIEGLDEDIVLTKMKIYLNDEYETDR